MLPVKKMEVKNIQKWTFQIKAGESEGRTEGRYFYRSMYLKNKKILIWKNDLNTEWKVA